MRGYWGQSAKTSEALVRNPLRADCDELVYRTGDLVTLEPAGNYAYLGRQDSMVKIRGYRVELGEVEATLYRHPAIREAVVLPVPDELLGNRLRAVLAADGTGNLTRENVLDHCRHWLPSYMVPEHRRVSRGAAENFDRQGRTGPASPRSSTNWSRPGTTDGTRPSKPHGRNMPEWKRSSTTTSAGNSSGTGTATAGRRDITPGERHPRFAEPPPAGRLPGRAVRDHDGRRGSAPGEFRQREHYLRLPPRPGARNQGPPMGDGRAGRLLRNVEGAAYWAAVAPVLPDCQLPSATASHAGAATGFSGAGRETDRTGTQPAAGARE